MISTANRVRWTTTMDYVWNGDILDGFEVTKTERDNYGDNVRVYLKGGGGWTDYIPVTREVSVWR